MHDRLQPKFQANAVMLQHFVGHLKFVHFWNIQFDDHNTKKSFWQNFIWVPGTVPGNI